MLTKEAMRSEKIIHNQFQLEYVMLYSTNQIIIWSWYIMEVRKFIVFLVI